MKHRLREFYEYNVKPSRDLLLQGEIGFFVGVTVESLLGWNPYFRYRKFRNKDRVVCRRIRGHEMRLDLYDKGISRHLFIRGAHELEATKAFAEMLARLRDETDDVVTILEIGANIGYYTLEEASVLGDRASIIALEPDTGCRSLLETNIEQNGYSNVVDIVPMAVDETSGERRFLRSDHSNWNRLDRAGESENADQIVETVEVETTSVDDLLDDRAIDPSKINVIRMDLEGQESKILESMERVLEADGPLALFVEFHPDFVGQSTYVRSLSLLEQYGFEIQFVNQRWNVLSIDTFDELKEVRGSHVRVIAVRK